MGRPAVSVIVTARDLEALIGEALTSILGQTRAVDQIIAVDDASLDGTGDVLRRLARQEPRLSVVTGQGRGAAAARNLGLRSAAGDVITFLDGDDVWPREKIERQMERLAADDAPDIVSGLIRRFMRFDPTTLAPADAETEALPAASLAACLFRRQVFATIGNFDETLRWSDDHDLMLRAREAGFRIAIMKQVTLYYRRRPGSLTHAGDAPRDFQMLKILHRSIKRRRQAGSALHLSPFVGLMDPTRTDAQSPVSVVVPLFNGRRFIRQAIASITRQTRPPREILVVDDGSRDGGASEIEATAGLRLIRQENGGEAAARNRGIREASQPFIAFLDQDDLWLPEKLEHQLAVMERNAGIDVAFGAHRLIVEQGADWFRRDLLGRSLTARLPGTLLVRRGAFARIGLFREDLKLGSDVDWTWRAADAGLVFHDIGEEVLLRRIHGDNASRDMPQFTSGLLLAAQASLKRKRS